MNYLDNNRAISIYWLFMIIGLMFLLLFFSEIAFSLGTGSIDVYSPLPSIYMTENNIELGFCDPNPALSGCNIHNGIDILEQPIIIHIKEGYAYQIIGGEQVIQLRKILKPFGKQSRNIAEFGIGTNPNAMLSGISFEDEKALGTAHIALGSPEYEGGIQRKNIHLDLILQKPTVEIDQRVVVQNGNLLV